MAKQKGSIKYVGTIGDVRHFKIKGKEGYFAGMTGGPSGEQIKTSPEFARTRENMSEFGACAKVGKSIRVPLSNVSKGKRDSSLTGRLTAVMKKVNLEDTANPRGKRSILISENKEYLNGFEFDKNKSIHGVLSAQFSSEYSPENETMYLEVLEHNPSEALNAPAGATHYKIISTVSVISDFAFNEITGIYEPVNTEVNEVMNAESSSMLDLSTLTEDLQISVETPPADELGDGTTILHCLAIEFFQKVGNHYYKFNQGNCMSVVGVY